MNRRRALALAVFPALSACFPEIAPPSDLYVLTPKSTFRPDLPKVDWQMVVEEPVAAAGLNTPRIALARSPTELDFFQGARWVDRAPAMVQTLLVESFENSKRIVAVGRQSIGLRADYVLKVELREFQAEFFRPPTQAAVHVRLNAKLIKQPERNILASESFESHQPLTSRDIRHVVDTFDEALGKVMRRIVEWTLVQGK
ncbi:MAG: hypothetical protein FJX46_11310 [Alphaproteobacteria bacterium]|nr:hypothetical protein [Alphaproteobacteria bacterium]